MMVKHKFGTIFGALLWCGLAACGQTGIRNAVLTQEKNLPRPGRILVYDFAVSEREVTEYQGIMRQQPSVKDSGVGFTIERVSRGTATTGNELLVDGQFLTVDEGSPLRRLVIGFGSGTSTVESRAQIYQGGDGRKILEFTTHSDSGMMPGAAATLGAGAAVQGGVTAGMVVANTAISGVKTYNSDVARMAAASGDQVVRYLSEFFAQQGWIRSDQVRKARIAY